MNLKNRWVWVGILALAVIVLLSLFVAPQSPKLQQGSTYSRAPGGYGAWYAYMERQQSPIQRWQRPLDKLPKGVKPTPSVKQVVNWEHQSNVETQSIAQSPPLSPITLMQISGDFSRLGVFDQEWVKQGNTLVLIGEKAPVTKAPFRSSIDSPAGTVKIETARRYDLNGAASTEKQTTQPRLSDSFGAVVWEQQLGEGRVIYTATPYLAANAYQDEPGNFKFLAQLVSEPGYPIYVDEYLHGYKDKAEIAEEDVEGLANYLAKTPLLLLAIQAAVLLLVLVWGQNQRLGPSKRLVDKAVDNSEAYIQALAGVLHKANCSDFVVETIGKAEQLQMQRALGLGPTLIDPQSFINAWVQQTGCSTAELQEFFDPLITSKPLNDRELLLWLEKLQTLRGQLE